MPQITMPESSAKGPLAKSNSSVEDDAERPEWGNKWESFLTLVGYAVGIGNVWRFPYLCFDNGGAVFLIPYLFIVCFLGVPIFALESAAGQAYKQGSLQVWGTINPYFSGLGVASLFCTWMVSLYYNVIIAWSLYYLGASFIDPLPWLETTKDGNTTMNEDMFFNDEMLMKSSNINDGGDMNWELWLCFTIAWIMIWGIICKGIESAGKVVYFTATFPYLILCILVFYGVSLDGAGEGLEFYLVPEWDRLLEYQIWVKAGQQVFYSLGVGWGSIITFGSFNKKDHDFISDSLTVPFINAMTSFFGGFAVFGTMGYLAKKQGVDVADLNLGGTGLAFIAYPTALGSLPASNFFAVLFFFMLLLLGIDSQFAMSETVVTAIIDSGVLPRWIISKENKWLVAATTCLVCYFIGFMFIGENGLYFLDMIDSLAVGSTLFAVAALESIAIAYVLGVDNFVEKCKDMLGSDLSIKYEKMLAFYKICWAYISPAILIILFFVSTISMFTSKYWYIVCADDLLDDKNGENPKSSACEDAEWGINFGITVAIIGILIIPGFALLAWRNDGKKPMRESLYSAPAKATDANIEMESNFPDASLNPVHG